MEIKRVIAGGLAVLTAGATLALGAGAATLGDFVTVTGNTMTSPYIVIGDNAAAEDTLAAADIGVALAGQATTTVTVPGAQGTMSVSDGVLIEGEAYKLYISTALDSTTRKPDLTLDDLPVMLGGGTVDHKTITDVDYDELLSLGGNSVTFTKESEWDEGALNLKFDDSSRLYTYKIIFGSGLDSEYVEGKSITILGKEFVFSSQDADLDNTSLVLFAAGQTETIAAGASATVTVEGSDYVVTVVGVNVAGDAATIDVNGEAFDVNVVDDNYIQKGDLNLYIKSIRAFKYPAESGSVQVFIGSDKLTLDADNNEIQKGNDKVDGAWLNFTQVSANKIYEIEIRYTADDDVNVLSGESYTDPVFGAFKIAFGGIMPALDSDAKDLVRINKNGNTKVKLTFTNKAGQECSMDVYNTTEWAYGTKMLRTANPTASDARTGMDSWNQSGNISEGDYFLVSQNYNSYILQYVSTDSTNNLVRLKNMCTSTNFDASITTQFFYLGGQKYEFVINTDSETIRLNQTGASSPSASNVPLYTSGKAAIVLNYADAKRADILLTEAPFSVAGIQGASQITMNVSATISTGNIDTVDIVNASASLVGTGLLSKEDTDLSYGVTTAGTYVVRDSDADTLAFYTPEVPTPVYVAVGNNPAFSTAEGVTGGTVDQAVQIQNSIGRMESDITASTLDRHVVLIGGPCANALVGEVLNMSASRPQCSADFVALYPTEGVISVVEDAFVTGKMALVVAGVDRDATRALAVKVMQGTVSYSN